MMKIVIASNNKHKISEIKAILHEKVSKDIELLSLSEIGFFDDIEENGKTFEENALIKAMAVADLGYMAMADDSGLMVDRLDGAPGVYSARYAGEPCNDENNNQKLLLALEGTAPHERSAKFVSTIAFVDPARKDHALFARGECPGEILYEYRGNGGFGYDPLFYYAPLDKTFAELTAEEKNSISHRARALDVFCEMLKKELNIGEE
ncbi:MAG: XTP/dITP diphosphatase [Clostridia bacterium]|nr:XTP/dITP diphosphatase [Clostridia bacterium]